MYYICVMEFINDELFKEIVIDLNNPDNWTSLDCDGDELINIYAEHGDLYCEAQISVSNGYLDEDIDIKAEDQITGDVYGLNETQRELIENLINKNLQDTREFMCVSEDNWEDRWEPS